MLRRGLGFGNSGQAFRLLYRIPANAYFVGDCDGNEREEMLGPILIVKGQDVKAGTTTITIDVVYFNSFCELLENNNIKFKPASSLTREWGINKNKERWDFLSRQILVQNIDDVQRLIESWFPSELSSEGNDFFGG